MSRPPPAAWMSAALTGVGGLGGGDLVRPASAPSLARRPPSAGVEQQKARPKQHAFSIHIPGVVPRKGRGFATSVSMSSLTKSDSLISLALANSQLQPNVSLYDPEPGVVVRVQEPTEMAKLRQKGTDAWLARDFSSSASAFGDLASLLAEEKGLPHAQALRLRGAALLRSKQYDEALVTALTSLASIGQPEADPKTDKEFFELVALAAMGSDSAAIVSPEALPAYQLHGEACLGLGQHQAAAHSLGRALLLATVDKSHGPASRAVQSLLAQFLDASGRASVATMPLQVYAVAAEGLKQAAAAGTVSASMRARRLGQYTPTPCFRLVLRPRFAPWPLEIHLAELPRVMSEEQDGVRLSFFCAFEQMPSEPHTCLYANRSDKHALVLVSIRLDGQLELVSNSTEACWEQATALFGHPPQPRSLHDFDVISSGWAASGVAVHAFGALVRTKWKEWDEGRGRAAKARKQKERVQRERQAELLRWLQDLDLDELHPLLVREGVDLTTLQYIAEADLSRLGVTQLGQRRKLLAAVRTQEQYKHLTEKLATLEAEKITLMQEHARQGSELDQRTAELSAACADVGRLTSALTTAEAEREAARREQQGTAAELATSSEKVTALQAKSDAFAADIEVLLEQLHASSDGQRRALQEIRTSIDVETFNLKEAVRRGPKHIYRPTPKRPSVAHAVEVGDSIRGTSASQARQA